MFVMFCLILEMQKHSARLFDVIFDVALVNRKPECKHVPALDFEKHTLQCIFVHCYFDRATELLYCFCYMSAFCKDSEFEGDFVYFSYSEFRLAGRVANLPTSSHWEIFARFNPRDLHGFTL